MSRKTTAVSPPKRTVPTTGSPKRRQSQRAMALVGVMTVLMMILAATLIGVVGSTAGAAGGSLTDVTDNQLHSTKAHMRFYGAQNVAETGVRMTIQWLTTMTPAPSDNVAFAPGKDDDNNKAFFRDFDDSTTITAKGYRRVRFDKENGNNYFDVRLYPYKENLTNTKKSYVIESIAHYQGQVQIVRAAVSQSSFAIYAFFTHNAPTQWFAARNNVFGGPVHINNANNGNLNIAWLSDAADPKTDQIFQYDAAQAFTTSSPDSSFIKWHKGDVTDNTPPTSDLDFEHVKDVKATMAYGVPEVKMPKDADQGKEQREAASGPSKTPPTQFLNSIPVLGALNGVGVAIPNNSASTGMGSSGSTNGGIIINGNVDSMVLSADADSSGNKTKQVINIYQTSTNTILGYGALRLRTEVMLDRVNNTTKVQTFWSKTGESKWNAMAAQNYTGTTNGIVYANGDIGINTNDTNLGNRRGGIHGVIADNYVQSGVISQRNALTIATDKAKNINIDGSIVYNTVNQTDTATTSKYAADKVKSGMLGIVSTRVQIVKQFYEPFPTNKGKPDVTGQNIQNLKLHATVMAYDTFNVVDPLNRNPGLLNLLGGYIAKDGGSFGQVQLDGTVLKGYRKANNYDDRMVDSPPPGFPSTNTYRITSYQRAMQDVAGGTAASHVSD